MQGYVAKRKFDGKWQPTDVHLKDPVTTKFGGKTVYIDVAGGRAKRQFARARVPFPVRDTDFDGNPTDIRNMNVEMKQDDLDFVRALEAHVVDEGVKNCKKWFGKKMSREVVESKLESLIKNSKSGDFPPTVRTKTNCDPRRPESNTVVRLMVDEDKGEYELSDLKEVTRNSEVVTIGTFQSVWFAGGMFGVKLAVNDMILYKQKSAWEQENPFEGFDIRPTKRKRDDGADEPPEPSPDTLAFDIPLVVAPPNKKAKTDD